MRCVLLRSFVLVSSCLAACGGGGSPPSDAGSDAGVDGGAEQVDEATFEQLKASGDARLDDPLQQQRDDESAAQQAQQDAQLVTQFIASHSSQPAFAEYLDMLDDEVDPSLTRVASGYELPLENGRRVLTMGEGFKRGALAASLRALESQTAQAGAYAALIAAVPDQLREANGLPSAAAVAAMTTAEARRSLTSLADKSDALLGRLVPPNLPVTPLRTCAADEGKGALLDRYGFNDRAAVDGCVPSETGLLKKFEFPVKPHLGCVKDQGARGTCWAFSITSMLETLESLQFGRKVNFSEQDLVARTKLIWNPKSYADADWPGDVMVQAAAYEYQPVPESFWSYNPSPKRVFDEAAKTISHSCDDFTEDCSDTVHQTKRWCFDQQCVHAARPNPNTSHVPAFPTHLMDFDNLDKTVSLLKLAVNLGRPAALTFGVYTRFKFTDRGYIRYVNGEPLDDYYANHVVQVVGYVSNLDFFQSVPDAPIGEGGGYFIVKNSWGPCDGDGGYKYMPVSYLKRVALAVEVIPALQ